MLRAVTIHFRLRFIYLFVYLFIYLRFIYLFERRGGTERERESQAEPTLSAEPDMGLNLMTLRL